MDNQDTKPKTRLTPEELAKSHDGLCAVSLGDGKCSCLVHWVEGLQKEADALKASLAWSLTALDTVHGRSKKNDVTYAYAAEDEYQKARRLLA